jgi:hypothetical protein
MFVQLSSPMVLSETRLMKSILPLKVRRAASLPGVELRFVIAWSVRVWRKALLLALISYPVLPLASSHSGC